MGFPSLSIIIPLYNKVDYIERCISSIINQNYQDYEVIIIDDGSTDGSDKAITRHLSDNRVKLFRIPNSGVSSARNKGIDIATGEFVLFIDADDYIDRGYLQNIMHIAKENNADIYIWGITKNRTNGSQVSVIPDLSGMYSLKDFLSLFVKEQYQKHKGLYGYIPNKLLKRSILKEHHLTFDASMKLMEDYDFFLSYYSYCKSFYCFDETGYHYVAYTTNQKGAKRNTNYIQLIDVHEKCREMLKYHCVLTDNNELLISHAVGGLALSLFLEMPQATYKTVNEGIDALRARPHSLLSLSAYHTNKRILKRLIIGGKSALILLYLKFWSIYLSFKTRK